MSSCLVPIANIKNVILDCKELLSQMHNTKVLSRNAATHGLVGVTRNLGSRTWMGNVPDPVSHIICNDLPFI